MTLVSRVIYDNQLMYDLLDWRKRRKRREILIVPKAGMDEMVTISWNPHKLLMRKSSIITTGKQMPIHIMCDR